MIEYFKKREEYNGNRLRGKKVFHDMINKVLELVALNKDSHIPHEWYFINVLIKEIEKNNKLAEEFVMYISQYYPNYRWTIFIANEYLENVIIRVESFKTYQIF